MHWQAILVHTGLLHYFLWSWDCCKRTTHVGQCEPFVVNGAMVGRVGLKPLLISQGSFLRIGVARTAQTAVCGKHARE